MEGTVGYNLKHGQLAPRGATPVYIDTPYAISVEATVDQDNEKLGADASKPVTAYSAPEGSGSETFGKIDLPTIALMTGSTASTSGAGAAAISRVEVKGSSQPPSLIAVYWIPNVDGNSMSAGLRMTLPNVKFSVPSASFDQETFANMEPDMTFDPDANDVLIIYEEMSTAPVFTAGVMPTNLTAPA